MENAPPSASGAWIQGQGHLILYTWSRGPILSRWLQTPTSSVSCALTFAQCPLASASWGHERGSQIA